MNKKEFIATFETTLINANLEVIALELLDNDTVQIAFKGGGKRRVNIEADSYGTIINDIMKCCMG